MLTLFRNKFGYLKNVSSKSDPKIAQRIVTDIRKKLDDVSIVGAALVALYNLGGKPDNRGKLFDMGVMNIILLAMKTHPAEERLLQTACASIKHCCGNVRGSINLGASDQVLKCMHDFPENVELQTAACRALQALCASPYGAAYTMKAEGNTLLINAMKKFHANNSFLTAACGAVAAIASHSNEKTSSFQAADSEFSTYALNSIWKLGVGSLVIAGLRRPDSQKDESLARSLIAAVWALGHPISMARLGGAVYVVKLLKAFHHSKFICLTALLILTDYAARERTADVIITAGAAKAIITVLNEVAYKEENEVQETGFHALCNISYWKEDKRALIDSGIASLTRTALDIYGDHAAIIALVIGINANIATMEPFAKRLLKKKVHVRVAEVAKIHRKNEALILHTINLFRNLSFYDELRVLPLVGSIPLIERAKKRFPDNKNILEYGNAAIERMEENRA